MRYGILRYLYAAVDFLFPPQCLLCGEFIFSYNDGYLCGNCLDAVCAGDGPLCVTCGMWFESPEGAHHRCGTCTTNPPHFDCARAAGAYEGLLRTAIHDFKYRHKTALAKPLAQVLAERGAHMLPVKSYDVIIPVPLHPQRLRDRGYNQALMLAERLAGQWDVPVWRELLRRNRRTQPQTVLVKKERRKNVRGAFSYCGRPLDGKRILLVDDVLTSGSTVNECARVLKLNKAKQVDVITLARVR